VVELGSKLKNANGIFWWSGAVARFFTACTRRSVEVNLAKPFFLLDSHNTVRLFALINLPVHLIINTFTH
jgi:hypothetical protein